MNKIAAIHALRALVPGFTCAPGCTECCGMAIPMSRTEWKLIVRSAGWRQRVKKKQCPYLNAGRCECYEERPMVCRLFGVIPVLSCPKGGKAERILSLKEQADIEREYLKVRGKNDVTV